MKLTRLSPGLDVPRAMDYGNDEDVFVELAVENPITPDDDFRIDPLRSSGITAPDSGNAPSRSTFSRNCRAKDFAWAFESREMYSTISWRSRLARSLQAI